jgi:diguanylate cyclase (GGDEF)-like protein
MFKPTLGFAENPSNEDVLSVYRERLMYRFAIVFIALFLPLTIFNFVRGQNALATAIGCALVIVILNAAAIYLKKDVPIARTVFIVGLAVVVGIALANRGVYGTYWAYPTVLFISFSVPRRLAKIYTAIFFLYCSLLMFYLLNPGLALRAVVGLGITILFTNIFLGIIEKLQEKLVEQSVIDPLTGAFNRRQMVSSLEEAIERKRRTRTPASILVFDIDDFKSINDNHGHAAGDHVLKKFVSLVSKRARRLDQLFRTGGEEFMLFLPDTPGSGALMLAEEIRVLISEADFIDGRPVTVSIGLSELEAGETVDDWLRHGDQALYSAKENGRNQVFSRMNPIISNRLIIGKDSLINAVVFD